MVKIGESWVEHKAGLPTELISYRIYVIYKLECLALSSFSQPSLFVMGQGRGEHLKGVSLRYAPALNPSIRLGCKGLAGTNTPAYY